MIAINADSTVREMQQYMTEWTGRMGWHNKTPLESLALIMSEGGEACNECRGEKPTEKLPTELADIVIRTFSFAGEQGIDLAAAIVAKMEINEVRGTRGRLK